MKLVINYKNGKQDIFEDGQIDNRTWTIRGHASEIIKAWSERQTAYLLDGYNAVLMSEVQSIRVIEK